MKYYYHYHTPKHMRKGSPKSAFYGCSQLGAFGNCNRELNSKYIKLNVCQRLILILI